MTAQDKEIIKNYNNLKKETARKNKEIAKLKAKLAVAETEWEFWYKRAHTPEELKAIDEKFARIGKQIAAEEAAKKKRNKK